MQCYGLAVDARDFSPKLRGVCACGVMDECKTQICRVGDKGALHVFCGMECELAREIIFQAELARHGDSVKY